MNGSPISPQSSKSNYQSSMINALPQWEQLPMEHQQEMVLTLAAMLTRQLTVPQQLPIHLEQQEVRSESAP